MNRGFVFSTEAVLAASVLVLLAGSLVLLSTKEVTQETNAQWIAVQSLLATQTRELTNRVFSAPLPPSDYYCFRTFSYRFDSPDPAVRLVKNQNCENTETLPN